MLKLIKCLILCLLFIVNRVTLVVALPANDTVTSLGTGNTNISFSNGYQGFCLDRDKAGAYVNDVYTTADNTTAATSNVDNRDISQALKVLFTQCFSDLFVSDGSGSYKLDNTNLAQAVIWHFTENQYIWGDQKTLTDKVKDYSGPEIPDSGYQTTLDNGDVITFYFLVIQPEKNNAQDFFAYRITTTRGEVHEHDYGDEWESDDTSHWHECECGDEKDKENHSGGTADCENPAECEICDKPYGETDDDNHTGNTEIRNQKDATVDAPGYTGDTYCKDCGDLLEEGSEIPKLHEHDYSEEWESDDTSHWHECECGDEKGKATHTGGTANCINPAECETCDKPYGETDDENHTGNTEIRNQEDATVNTPGYTGDTYCKDCGDLLEEGREIPQLHEHDYSEEWESDDTSHWHECECGDKKDVETHTGKSECKECGYPLEEEEKDKPTASHWHNYSKEWESDDTSHWHECRCGDEKDDSNHSGGTADCINPAECEICDKPYGETNDENHTGNTEIRNQVDATENAPGYTGDTYCKDCGDLLEEGKEIPQLYESEYSEEFESDDKSELVDEKDDLIHTGDTDDSINSDECETCDEPYGETNNDDAYYNDSDNLPKEEPPKSDFSEQTIDLDENDEEAELRTEETDIPKEDKPSETAQDDVVTITNTTTLIQTGQSNWPILVLGSLGVLMILYGVVIVRRKKENADA